jgi:hypothetical protein
MSLLEEVRHICLAIDAEEVEPINISARWMIRTASEQNAAVVGWTYQSSTFKLIGTMGACRPPEL